MTFDINVVFCYIIIVKLVAKKNNTKMNRKTQGSFFANSIGSFRHLIGKAFPWFGKDTARVRI